MQSSLQRTAMLKFLSTSAFKIRGSEPLQKTLVNKFNFTLVPEQARVKLVNSNIRLISSRYIAEMNSKHLATGAPLPPLQDGKLRIYNMRFCPYGQRAVLVALAKEIPNDIVNCNLKQKPEFLLERNPGGKVPTIETPKGPLYESLIVADYLDEVYPQRQLRSADPFQRALDRIWIENFSKVSTTMHKVVMAREDTETVKGLLVELADALAPFEAELKRRGTQFFGGNTQPGMLDYMIWPWFERLPLLKIFFPTLYDFDAAKKQNANLEKWRQAMKEDPAVKTFLLAPEVHHQFYLSFLAGKANYDVDYDSIPTK